MTDSQGDGWQGSPPDEVTLRGLRFHALVGILPHERVVPQPLEIDVTAWVPHGELVDYRGIHDAVRAVVEGETLDYLERVGDAIAQRILEVGPVARARVALRKPHVTLPTPLSYAEVVVTRARDV
jgi:7,8-dihydroneopterin aldolase/epimerase/oxygenase